MLSKKVYLNSLCLGYMRGGTLDWSYSKVGPTKSALVLEKHLIQ